MASKANPSTLFTGFWKTLRTTDGRPAISDLFWLCALPVLAGVAAAGAGVTWTSGAGYPTPIGVLLGLFLNAAILAQSLQGRLEESKAHLVRGQNAEDPDPSIEQQLARLDRRITVVRELTSQALYATLVGALLLTFVLVPWQHVPALARVAGPLGMFTAIHLGIVVLMVLKRTSKLVDTSEKP